MTNLFFFTTFTLISLQLVLQVECKGKDIVNVKNAQLRLNLKGDVILEEEEELSSIAFRENFQKRTKIQEEERNLWNNDYYNLNYYDDYEGGNNYDDDYYKFGKNYTQKNFNGYAFKFGKCQKIQRFSDKAVRKGLYSAVVTDDIVVFRLCPERRCADSSEYGCTAGYGEYAIELREYLRIMFHYQKDKMENLCLFCATCSYGNRRELDEEEKEHMQQDAYDNQDGNNLTEQSHDKFEGSYNTYNYTESQNYGWNNDNYYNGDDAGYSSITYSSDVCNDYQDTCNTYGSSCENGDYADTGYMDYLDYFNCIKVDYHNTYYYLKPTCDITYNQIVMGIFYDPFCSQYAGKDVNVNKITGINFSRDVFLNASKRECLTCDYSESPPYYNSNNFLCNKLFHESARCDVYFAYDLGDDEIVDEEQSNQICTFIENIRYGSYKDTGEVSDSSSYTGEITATQIMIIATLAIISLYFALLACYLHHQITNFLLWQLTLKGSLLPATKEDRARKITIDKNVSSDYSEFS